MFSGHFDDQLCSCTGPDLEYIYYIMTVIIMVRCPMTDEWRRKFNQWREMLGVANLRRQKYTNDVSGSERLTLCAHAYWFSCHKKWLIETADRQQTTDRQTDRQLPF